MTRACPHCGQKMPFGVRDVRMMADRGTVSRGSVTVQLTCTETTMLDALLHAYPGFRSVRGIFGDMYGDRSDPPSSESIVKVLICRMRKKLRPLGLGIVTQYGFGYRLHFEGRP